jgi:hypothetical protein
MRATIATFEIAHITETNFYIARIYVIVPRLTCDVLDIWECPLVGALYSSITNVTLILNSPTIVTLRWPDTLEH